MTVTTTAFYIAYLGGVISGVGLVLKLPAIWMPAAIFVWTVGYYLVSQ